MFTGRAEPEQRVSVQMGLAATTSWCRGLRSLARSAASEVKPRPEQVARCRRLPGSDSGRGARRARAPEPADSGRFFARRRATFPNCLALSFEHA